MSRRLRALALGTALILSGLSTPALGQDTVAAPPTSADATLTLLATTDVHGNVMNYDYFADKPYGEGQGRGLARVDSIVDHVRQEVGTERVVVLDNGDAIQGTPLTYLAATKPLTPNPMAKAYNLIGYDAQVVGNHEFNYGLPYLKSYADQLDFQLLAANVLKEGTQEPFLDPYTMITRTINGQEITIGVLGVVTPGVRIWDAAHVSGTLTFQDPVEAAQTWVPQMRQAGADVVVALVHSGIDPSNQTWDPTQLQENVAKSVAEKVSGIDVVIGGHSHVKDKGAEVFTNPDGDPVLFSQPIYWAQSVSRIDLPLSFEGDKVTVSVPKQADAAKQLISVLRTSEVTDSPDITNDPTLASHHQATIAYANQVVTTAPQEMASRTSRYEDTPIMDAVAKVMTDVTAQALADSPYAKLPVVAQVSPFSRTSVFPKGEVRIKDIAGLYIYDNTLQARLLTGKDLKEYMEYSARYYDPATVYIDECANNKCGGAVYNDKAIPDYNLDLMSGVSYLVNMSAPVGQRISHLSWPDGRPVADDDKLVLAVNNYRSSGGGGFPGMGAATQVIYDEQVEIRQALIEWASQAGSIDPATFFTDNWALVDHELSPSLTVPTQIAAGTPVTVTVTDLVPGRMTTLKDGSGTTLAEPLAANQDGAVAFTIQPEAHQAGTLVLTASQPPLTVSGNTTVTTVAPTGDDTDQGTDANSSAAHPGSSGSHLARTGTDVLPLAGGACLITLLGLALRRRSRMNV